MSEYNKVEGMLYKYIELKAQCKNIDIEIEELKSVGNLQSIDYSKDVLSPTNNISSSVENELINIEQNIPDKISKLENKKKSKERIINRIDNALNILTEKEKYIIEYRYFKKLEWNKISELIDLSDVRCRQIRKEAINNIIDVIFTIN